MAIMYPKNIELYNHTMSEKMVYKALEAQLPDTYSVYYSVQWVDSIQGQKKESECDFLIFSENDGFLTCEVKGGIGYRKEDERFILVERDGERTLTRSPMEQAEESSRYFYNLYGDEYNDSFNGIYGSISLFPLYDVDDPVLLDHRPKDIVFDRRDMNELDKRIKKAFQFYRGKYNTYGSLTKNQRKNFKEMIDKKVATKAAAGTIIDEKEFELNNVNRIQDNLIYFLSNYSRTFITGGAGTGKTWIAYKFAKQASLLGKNVLVTTRNQQLIRMFKGLLDGYGNITILSLAELIERDGLDANTPSGQLICEYDSVIFDKYDCVIVDEAQDFDQYEAMIISLHLRNDDSEMRVFYDMTQNINDKYFKDGFDIAMPPFVLRENLRNTESIYEWAKDETNLGKEVITNQIIGPAPIKYGFKKMYDLKKYMEAEIVKLVDKENVPITSIVILLDHDNFGSYDGIDIGRWKCVDSRISGSNDLKIALVEDFKGLEANIVFYIHGMMTPEKYNYVAYTRAKYYLYDLIQK